MEKPMMQRREDLDEAVLQAAADNAKTVAALENGVAALGSFAEDAARTADSMDSAGG